MDKKLIKKLAYQIRYERNISETESLRVFLQELLEALLSENPPEKVNCIRCNDNGCPACNGTKGDPHNPEPY